MYDTDFDGQRLMFHPDNLVEWLTTGRTSGPLYTEIELSRICNCNCCFCGVDYQVNSTNEMMGLDLAKKIIGDLAELGNKSVMFCGNGEPLLNPEAAAIVHFASSLMNVSVTTNGTALTEGKLPLLMILNGFDFQLMVVIPRTMRLSIALRRRCLELLWRMFRRQ